jgi:hypothetical protein
MLSQRKIQSRVFRKRIETECIGKQVFPNGDGDKAPLPGTEIVSDRAYQYQDPGIITVDIGIADISGSKIIGFSRDLLLVLRQCFGDGIWVELVAA